MWVNSNYITLLCCYGLNQACSTQTTSRAAKALKTAKGAAKVLKCPQCGPYFKKSID